MKRILLSLLICFPIFLWAQEDNSKYLAGAVPVVNGKVIFTEHIQAPGLSKQQVYDVLLKWAEKRFTPSKGQKGRVAYFDKERGQIACLGEEYLQLSATNSFFLDRATIKYRLVMNCLDGSCKMEMYNISYFHGDNKEMEAEDWITDEAGLNKAKTKVVAKYGKLRIKTIDLFDDLTEKAAKALGGTETLVPLIAKEPKVVPGEFSREIPGAAADGSMAGYKRISADKIPGNIIKMLSEDWMLITAGTEEKYNMMTASWGGLGYLYNKPVSFCFIYPTRYTYQLMEKNDTYTISFYTEAYRDALKYCGSHSGGDTDKVKGAGLTPLTTPSGSKAFSEAWMIIECKKMLSQPIASGAFDSPELKGEWKDKPLHKMYIGEIINVWIK